jgi:hypothetical protein
LSLGLRADITDLPLGRFKGNLNPEEQGSNIFSFAAILATKKE